MKSTKPCLWATFICFFIFKTGSAQFQNLINNDSLMKVYLAKEKFAIDSTAQAIVLFEKALFDVQGKYKIERLVKILDQNAINDFAVVHINKGNHSLLRRLKSVTYNLEHGEINAQTFEKEDLLKEKITEDISLSKFNIPSIKTGSIIYYTYTLEFPDARFPPDWYFQGKYHKIHSEFEAYLPGVLLYKILERVNVPLKTVTRKSELETCEACAYIEPQVESKTAHNIWIRKNVPAFREEPFMSNELNYLERIKIHGYAVSSSGYTFNIKHSWDEISERDYYKNKYWVGQTFEGNAFLKNKVKSLTADQTGKMDKAIAIFNFVRDSFKVKEMVNASYQFSLKQIFNEKTGSRAGINLILVAMLLKEGLQSDPVLLSTRSNEKLNHFYPEPDDIDLIAARVNIDGKYYYLDATHKYLPFGLLEPNCYNGYARIVNEKGAAVQLVPDSLLDKSTIIVSLSPSSVEGKMNLKITQKLGLISSMGYRMKWKNDTAEIRKQIITQLKQSATPFYLKAYSVEKLEEINAPLLIHFEAELDLFNNESLVYFDPYFGKIFEKNPFPNTHRNFPIEMEHRVDYNYIFHLNLPPTHTLDESLQSVVLKYGDDGSIQLKNIVTFSEEDRSFSLNSRYLTKTTLFPAEDYPEILAFYENLIAEQHKKIIIKKIQH